MNTVSCTIDKQTITIHGNSLNEFNTQTELDEIENFNKLTCRFSSIIIDGFKFNAFKNINLLFDSNNHQLTRIEFKNCDFNCPDELVIVSNLCNLFYLGFKNCDFNKSNFAWMISNCENLTTVEFNDCNTKQVEFYEYMFNGCPYVSNIFNSEYGGLVVNEFEGYI